MQSQSEPLCPPCSLPSPSQARPLPLPIPLSMQTNPFSNDHKNNHNHNHNISNISNVSNISGNAGHIGRNIKFIMRYQNVKELVKPNNMFRMERGNQRDIDQNGYQNTDLSHLEIDAQLEQKQWYQIVGDSQFKKKYLKKAQNKTNSTLTTNLNEPLTKTQNSLIPNPNQNQNKSMNMNTNTNTNLHDTLNSTIYPNNPLNSNHSPNPILETTIGSHSKANNSSNAKLEQFMRDRRDNREKRVLQKYQMEKDRHRKIGSFLARKLARNNNGMDSSWLSSDDQSLPYTITYAINKIQSIPNPELINLINDNVPEYWQQSLRDNAKRLKRHIQGNRFRTQIAQQMLQTVKGRKTLVSSVPKIRSQFSPTKTLCPNANLPNQLCLSGKSPLNSILRPSANKTQIQSMPSNPLQSPQYSNQLQRSNSKQLDHSYKQQKSNQIQLNQSQYQQQLQFQMDVRRLHTEEIYKTHYGGKFGDKQREKIRQRGSKAERARGY